MKLIEDKATGHEVSAQPQVPELPRRVQTLIEALKVSTEQIKQRRQQAK